MRPTSISRDCMRCWMKREARKTDENSPKTESGLTYICDIKQLKPVQGDMTYLYIYNNGSSAPAVAQHPRKCTVLCTGNDAKTMCSSVCSFMRILMQTMYQTMCGTICQTITEPIAVFARDSAQKTSRFNLKQLPCPYNNI